MAFEDLQLSHKHQNILNRFLAACQADDRIIAAFWLAPMPKARQMKI